MKAYLVLRAEETPDQTVRGPRPLIHYGIITVTGAESPEDACHQVAEVTGRFGQYCAVEATVVPMNLGGARLVPMEKSLEAPNDQVA